MMKVFFAILLLALGEIEADDELIALKRSDAPRHQKEIQPYKPSTPPAPPPQPWLTGPLIVASGTVYSTGHFAVNNYVFTTTNVGTYSKDWKAKAAPRNFTIVNPQFLTYVGITPWMDINFTPQFFYQTTSNQQSWNFGDFPIGFDFQVFDAGASPYFPGIKFFIKEIFPTGPYQRLNPKKLLTDSSGLGSFSTQLGFLLYKVYHLAGECFLSTFYSAGYTINSPISVHGLSAYGGGKGTAGRVFGGNSFQGIFSFELTLSQNWAIAMDSVYTHTDQTYFSGTTTTSVGGPSSEQISFAPAIEYNFSSNFGICTGYWFTAWGRNSTEFRSGVINFVYNY